MKYYLDFPLQTVEKIVYNVYMAKRVTGLTKNVKSKRSHKTAKRLDVKYSELNARKAKKLGK